jgi:predicted amidohydrolase YtcJ
MQTPSKAIRAYQILREERRLTLRVGIVVRGSEDGLVESFIRAGIRTGSGDEWLRIIGVQWCPDCSTSGRTVAYYEPYVGTPVIGEPSLNYGKLLYEKEDLRNRAIATHRAGLRLCMDGVLVTAALILCWTLLKRY